MSDQNDVHDEINEEREFSGSSSSAIYDAPLSWVALFGALLAVGSLVPIIVYPGGGGYSSLSNTVLFVLAGFILGPWAGLVAGLIGGAIGLFIAPGAFPLGLVDVVLAAGLQCLLGGLMAAKWRKFLIVWWLLNLITIWIFPYRWPGPAQGFETPTGFTYIASYWWILVGFLLLFVWAYTPVGKWVYKGEKIFRQGIGFVLASYVALTGFYGLYGNTYYYLLKYPIERTITENYLTAPLYMITAVIQGIVAAVVFRAFWRTGLRKVPGSLLDETS